MTVPVTGVLPEPFTRSFDFDDDHCSRGFDQVMEDLPEDIVAQMKAAVIKLDDDAVRTWLLERANQIEGALDGDDLDDTAVAELVDQLRSAAADLTFCEHDCTCAMDSYDSYGKEMLDYDLGELGDHVWAVSEQQWHQLDPCPDIDDTLDVDHLSALLSGRRGWGRCELTWNGEQLHVEFSGYNCGTTVLLLQPLNDAQKDAREAWSDAAPYDEGIAARVLQADWAALTAAATLWRDAEYPEELFGCFDDLLAAVTAIGADAASNLDMDVVSRLSPTWKAPLADLLRISCDVSAAASSDLVGVAA
jgi:hypothetical protein